METLAIASTDHNERRSVDFKGLIVAYLFKFGAPPYAYPFLSEDLLTLDIGPISLACVTWGVAALALLWVTRATLAGSANILRSEAGLLCLSALTGIAAFQGLWFAGLLQANATNVAILTATLPVMIAALAAIAIGEKLRPWQLFGVLLTLAGTLWVGVYGYRSVRHHSAMGRHNREQ